MSFLRRAFGRDGDGSTSHDPQLLVYDLPEVGYFEVAGVVHHKDALRAIFGTREVRPVVLSRGEIAPGIAFEVQGGTTGQETVEVPADLDREPGNRYDRNAVRVAIHGRTVGYVPRAHAESWSSFLLRCEAEGYRVRATARVWIGDDHYYVNLRARKDARYGTPAEAAAEEQAREAAAAEKDARKRAAEAAKAERAARRAQEAEWRAAGLCAACGGAIGETKGRGRRPIHCASCRAERASGQVAPVEVVTVSGPVAPDAAPDGTVTPAEAAPVATTASDVAWSESQRHAYYGARLGELHTMVLARGLLTLAERLDHEGLVAHRRAAGGCMASRDDSDHGILHCTLSHGHATPHEGQCLRCDLVVYGLRQLPSRDTAGPDPDPSPPRGSV